MSTCGKSLTLGDHFDEFIDELVNSGRYNSASQAVRAALRLLEDQEQLRQIKTDFRGTGRSQQRKRYSMALALVVQHSGLGTHPHMRRPG